MGKYIEPFTAEIANTRAAISRKNLKTQRFNSIYKIIEEECERGFTSTELILSPNDIVELTKQGYVMTKIRGILFKVSWLGDPE